MNGSDGRTKPQPVGATNGPAPWWHHRKPLTDAERLEYAAASFALDQSLERDLILQRLAPHLYETLSSDRRLAAETYAARRAAAVEVGKIVADPSPALVAEVERHVAEVRATERFARVDELHEQHREIFGTAIRSGDFRVAVAAWRAWRAAVAAEESYASHRAAARRALSLPGAGAILTATKWDFLGELGHVLDAKDFQP